MNTTATGRKPLVPFADAPERYFPDLTVNALRAQRAQMVEPGSLAFKIGGKLYFDPDDLEEYIAGQRAAHRAEIEYRRARLEELAS